MRPFARNWFSICGLVHTPEHTSIVFMLHPNSFLELRNDNYSKGLCARVSVNLDGRSADDDCDFFWSRATRLAAFHIFFRDGFKQRIFLSRPLGFAGH
jgi:hypothetical protein